MSNTVNIELHTLQHLLEQASFEGARRALELAGMTRTTITLLEIETMEGKAYALKARMSQDITWLMKGKGVRWSDVHCLKSEYDKYHFGRNFNCYNTK